MSTKSTIAHGEGFHLYQEMFETSAIYLQVDQGELEVSRGKITISIPPELMTQIAVGWLVNKERFDPQPEFEINMDWLKPTRDDD